jgi:peptide chain release factor 2
MSSFAGTRIWRAAPAICGAIFDATRPAEELAKIEERVGAPDFWKDQTVAQQMLQRRRRLEEDRDLSDSLRRKVEDLGVLVEWAEAGESVGDDLARGLDELSAVVDAGETKKMLGGEHDRKNAIVTIHPGAGGTESQDWAEMLLRMYLRWIERRAFRREVIDLQPGEDAGIKSATFTVTGDYAYGLLLAEAGVHRLRQRAATRRSPASSSGPSCPRTSTSRSRKRTCGSTRIARAAPAASTST